MSGSSPLTVLPISWGKCGEWDPSLPSTTATLAASLGSSGGIRCLVAITSFHRGTGTGFSQAGGDDPQTTESGGPACPHSQGDRTLLEVAGPASVSSGAAFNTVLCLKRLQSRSDARLGAKHGVGLNDAAAVLTLPLCVCVRARVCANLGRKGLLGVQEVSVGYIHRWMPGTSAMGRAEGCLKAVDACSGQG